MEPGIAPGHQVPHHPWAPSPELPLGTEPGIAHRNTMRDAEAVQTTAWTYPSTTPRSGKHPPAPLARLLQREWLLFGGQRTDGQGKLSSWWSASQGPDSSPGAGKCLSINNAASKRVPRPLRLNEALKHALKSHRDGPHISVFSHGVGADSGAWLSFGADPSPRLGGSSSALRLPHPAPGLLIL